MKKYIISILAVASVLFTGCNKEIASVNSDSRVVSISAALDATKVTTGSAIGKFAWEAGDVIGVWTGSEFTPFTIDAATVGQVAGTFTGTLPEGGSIGEGSYAVYPYCAEDTLEGSIYNSNYNGSNWGYKPAINLAAKPTATTSGSTTVASYKFAHLGAMAHLVVKNIPAEAKMIFLEAPSAILFGTGTADLSTDYPKLAPTGKYDYAFYVLPDHESAIDIDVYFPIVTGEYADPKFRFTLFASKADFSDFAWTQEMDKATYNHVGNLSTGGYINRGDLFNLPTVTF